MRILHIISDLGYGGAAGQLKLLAGALPSREFAQQVAVLRRRGPVEGELAAAGAPVEFLRQRFTVDPIAYGRLRRLAARYRPEVIHAWDANAADYAAPVARGASRPRLIATVRTLAPERTTWRRWRDRKMCAAVDRLVATSAGVADLWRSAGAVESKVSVIPIAAAPAAATSRDNLLAELNLPSDAKLIGVVGRLAPRNRIKELIWAADMVRVLHDNVRLLVIGAGPQQCELTRFARMASDLEHIRLLGPRADAAAILFHCDACWHNGELPGEPAAVIEALAAGTPVIVGAAPGREALVADGRGVLAPPDNRALWTRTTDEWFRDPAAARARGAAGKAYAESQHNVATVAAAYADVYRQLMS